MAFWRRFSSSTAGSRAVWSRLSALGLLLAVAVVAVLAVRLLPRSAPTPAAAPQIVLSSHPFPLIVGNNTLSILVLDATGAQAQPSRVTVDTSSTHPGTLPLSRPAQPAAAGGLYQATITWPMTGAWGIDVTAELPDGSVQREHFDVFVYPVPPENRSPRTTFVSASELAAMPYDPAREVRIIIPQGTNAGIVGGHGDDVIGDEIRLSVSGRNLLTIQNNDIVDHNVGPFTVRAGETVRQEFRRPAEYVGACSIRHGAEVSIIVEA